MFPRDGVDEAQCLCMETLTVEPGDAVVGAIHRVARHRMLDGRHVDADLMGAARLEAAFQQGKAAEALQHLIAGVGILGVGLAGRVDCLLQVSMESLPPL